jgi:integrase
MPYLMPSGKWRAKRMINWKVKTKVFATKQEAKKWEAMQEADKWEAENSETPMVCLLDFANAYLDMAKERFVAGTLAEKEAAFKRVFRIIPHDTQPEELTLSMVMQCLRTIALQESGNNANKTRKNLCAAWEWGKKYYGLPPLNPFREVEKFPQNEKPRYVPPEEDFWKAYSAASPRDQIFLLFMLHTGARKSEVFRLKWEDVDFTRRRIRLGTRKTGHGGMEYAWVPMTAELYSILAEHKLQNKSEYVFIEKQTGKPYAIRSHYMIRLCKRAGVKHFCFHAIRHLAATILAYGGLDIPSVQSILRHKNPNTTARYIKSLGVQPEKVDRIFENRKAPKILPFRASQSAVGT